MPNYRYFRGSAGWVDLTAPRIRLADGTWVPLNDLARRLSGIPSGGGGTPPDPSDFVYETTRPSRENTGVPAGTVLTTMTPEIANQLGTLQAATATTCAKWIPDAGITATGFIIPWAINNTQPGVSFVNCRLIGPQDITGGVSTSTRQNPQIGVVSNHAAAATILLTRCDIQPTIPWSGSTGVIGHHYTAERCYIADVVDCFGGYNINGAEAGVKVLGCFGERMTFFNNDPFQPNSITHDDWYQAQGGSDHQLLGNFMKGTWSPKGDIPAGSTTLDPMGSGLYVCNAAGGGGRLVTVTPNVNPVSNMIVRGNWGLSGITFALAIPTSRQGSSTGLGVFENNRDYGFHRSVSLGGVTEQVGIAHHPLMPWNSDWAGHAAGDRYVDNTHGNRLYATIAAQGSPDVNGTPSIIRGQNS